MSIINTIVILLFALLYNITEKQFAKGVTLEDMFAHRLPKNMTYYNLWLASRVSKMNPIACCDWLSERARGSYLARAVLPQGPKLRLTDRQCDQKLGVGDQNFRTGRQQATNLLSYRYLKFQGKRFFFKRKHKAPVGNCSKMKRRFYDRHIYLVPCCFSGFCQYGYRGRKRDGARSKVSAHTHVRNFLVFT